MDEELHELEFEISNAKMKMNRLENHNEALISEVKQLKDEMKDQVDFMAKTHAEELRNRELLLAEERKDFMMRLETERTEYEKTVEAV